MQTQTPKFDAWSDGSFSNINGQSGTGIVFTDELGETRFGAFSIPTSHLPIETSIQAEMVAATQALQLAKVFADTTGIQLRMFHSDNDAVLRLLSEGREPSDACSRPVLKLHCDNLRAAFEACGGTAIAVQYASDKKDAHLKECDRLAAIAATVTFEDIFRTPSFGTSKPSKGASRDPDDLTDAQPMPASQGPG